MKILLHGGDCCGIKHIEGFGDWPSMILCAREETKESSFFCDHWSGLNDMRYRRPDRGHLDFFYKAAPKETAWRRFYRFVKFITDNRTHGLIEVTLTKGEQDKWVPILKRKGFKMVTEFANSNSAETVCVWHLVH